MRAAVQRRFLSIRKEGSVAAIVLNHEKTDQQPGRRRGHEEVEPAPSGAYRKKRQSPEGEERDHRNDDFEGAALGAR